MVKIRVLKIAVSKTAFILHPYSRN